jgi:hypothetical protein
MRHWLMLARDWDECKLSRLGLALSVFLSRMGCYGSGAADDPRNRRADLGEPPAEGRAACANLEARAADLDRSVFNLVAKPGASKAEPANEGSVVALVESLEPSEVAAAAWTCICIGDAAMNSQLDALRLLRCLTFRKYIHCKPVADGR